MDFTLRFKVAGTGHFPIDMLRYDCCYPVNESESHKIGNSHDPTLDQETFQVELERRFRTKTDKRQWRPTVGRWSSFTWEVVEIEGVRQFAPPLDRIRRRVR